MIIVFVESVGHFIFHKSLRSGIFAVECISVWARGRRLEYRWRQRGGERAEKHEDRARITRVPPTNGPPPRTRDHLGPICRTGPKLTRAYSHNLLTIIIIRARERSKINEFLKKRKKKQQQNSYRFSKTGVQFVTRHTSRFKYRKNPRSAAIRVFTFAT